LTFSDPMNVDNWFANTLSKPACYEPLSDLDFLVNFDRNYTFKELIYCTNKTDGTLINFQTRLVDSKNSSNTLDL
jgi:hypothetical protein